MATIKKLTDNEIRMARRAGVKAKKPKKPGKKTYASVEAYIVRYNAWVDKMKDGVKKFKKKEADKKKLVGMKAQIAGL